LPFGNGERELVTYPGKRPLLRVTTRPPHLETPFSAFSEGAITPNNAFFVRYHLANIPKRIDAKAYRLRVGGHVRQSLSLSLDELKALAPPVEVVAVNQCSGNSRGFLNRVSSAPSWATAPWAMHAGSVCRCGPCWKKPACCPAPNKSR
jgi:sulfite dehydrogenase